jgi:hypothetical protein
VLVDIWAEMWSWGATTWGVIIALVLGVVNLAHPVVSWWLSKGRAEIGLRLERYRWADQDCYRCVIRNTGRARATDIVVSVCSEPWSAEDPYPPLDPSAEPPDGVWGSTSTFMDGHAEEHLAMANVEQTIRAVWWVLGWKDTRRKPQVRRSRAHRVDVT